MIAEKTGWTPGQIARLNLTTVELLLDAWAKEAKATPSTKPVRKATVTDALSLEKLTRSIS